MSQLKGARSTNDPSADLFRGIGYGTEDGGSTNVLDEQLRAVADAGFTHAELDPAHWEVWLGGKVNASALRRWSAVVERHRDRLAFTLHGPFSVNLFKLTDRELHERLLRAALEVARAVGASVTVIHPGRRPPPPVGASVSMRDLMAYERESLRAVADELAAWGGELAVETWIPYGDYSYAVWPAQLAEQIAAVEHPAIGVCLDFGHVYLSSRWYGFNYIDGIATLAPHVNHFHVQDLFGTPMSGVGNPELGEGDLHLPPGWGAIPFEDVFRAVSFPRRPVMLAELYPTRFLPELESVFDACKRFAEITPCLREDRSPPLASL